MNYRIAHLATKPVRWPLSRKLTSCVVGNAPKISIKTEATLDDFFASQVQGKTLS